MTRACAAGACAALLLAPAARADDGAERAGMRYAVGTTVMRDDNLFRLPDGVSPAQAGLGAGPRGETVVVPYADVEGLWLPGRQRVSATLRYSADRYRRYDAYDDRTLDYGLDWRWALAQSWDGRLAADERQTATSFADYRGTSTNILTTRALHAVANLRPRPDRRATLALDAYVGDNSLAARAESDFRIATARAEIGAASAQGNEVWLSAAHTEGRYPNRAWFTLAPIDNSYTQNQIGVAARYAPGAATRVELHAGRARRYYDEVPQRNFSGPVGSLDLYWQPTAKLTFRTTLAEEIGAIDDYFRIYVTTRIKGATLAYALTPKLSATLDAKRRELRYRGDPDNVLSRYYGTADTPDREDRLDELRATLQWQPTDRLVAILAWVRLNRASTQAGYQYRATQQQFTLQYQW